MQEARDDRAIFARRDTSDNFERFGVRAYVTSERCAKATKPIIALLTAELTINPIPVCVSPIIILSVNDEVDPREYFNHAEPRPKLFGEILGSILRCLTTMKLCT